MIHEMDYATAVARADRFRSTQRGFNAEVASAADLPSQKVASAE